MYISLKTVLYCTICHNHTSPHPIPTPSPSDSILTEMQSRFLLRMQEICEYVLKNSSADRDEVGVSGGSLLTANCFLTGWIMYENDHRDTRVWFKQDML